MPKPHPLFDPDYYLANNPDVADVGIDPFMHFTQFGTFEGRKPNAFFDPKYYLEKNPDVALAGENPLVHYLTHGATEGRDPSALFSTSWYVANNPDVAASGTNPLAHYLEYGIAEGRQPCPSSPNDSLLERYADCTQNKAPRRSIVQPTVMYVSGLPDNTSHIYRVEHQVEALNAAGIAADWCPVSEINSCQHLLIFSQVVVFFRVAWDDEVACIVDKCRRAGTRIVFDMDDYVFDPSIANEQNVDGLRFLKQEELPQYFDGVRRYHLMAVNADEGIVTTDFLARGFRSIGKPCQVIKNGFSRETLETSEMAAAEAIRSKTRQAIRIGYASGSMTHQRDFGVAAPALAQILTKNPHVTLTVVGLLDLKEFPVLEAFSDRVELRRLVPHHELPHELARFDISIAPLEVGNPFCEAKSELKYYEAALVRVPTVASATSPFCAAIRDGVTGFVVRTSDEWYVALDKLVNDATLRGRIADAAYEHAIKDYGPDAKRRQTETIFRSLIDSRQKKIRANPDAYSQTVTFVVPGIVRGSGGHNKIISIARWLADSGYTLLLVFTETTKEYPTPETIAAEYGFDERNVRVVYSDKLIAPSNITFATYWKTVYNIEHSDCWPGRRYHFLQDYEPYFFPMSTDYLLAINAMRKDFRKISYGPWIKKIIQERHRLNAEEIPFYIDKALYCVHASANRKPNQIIYFARPEMPRRCFDLGVEALRIYQQRYDNDADLLLFGSYAIDHARLPFRFTDMQVLKPFELAKLYNESTIGLVFSPTNPSMVPFEMMACGLPIIDLDVEGNAETYGGRDNAFFVDPDPEAIADRLHEALTNPPFREKIAENGQAFAAGMCNEDQAMQRLADLIRGISV